MNDKSEKASRSITRSIANINKQLAIVKEEYPEANFYVAIDNLHLMKGKSHDDMESVGNYENILDSYAIDSCDCGDW